MTQVPRSSALSSADALAQAAEHDRLVRFGEFFKGYRIKAGLSAEAISQALELELSVYLSYEQGRESMPLEDVFALTNLLNIAPEEVMDLVHELYLLGAQ